jgi:hypothetical protein
VRRVGGSSGHSIYLASICGHEVRVATAPYCANCLHRHIHRRIGKGWTAPCGHVAYHPNAKMCRACRLAKPKKLGYSYTGKKGYRFVRDGNGHERLEHVVIAERVLGRHLRKNEHVHHLNMNPSDNRNSNLLICDAQYHNWLHWEMARRFAREHFNA